MKKLLLVAALFVAQILHAQTLTPEITSWVINSTGATGYKGIPTNVQLVQYTATDVYVSATCIPGYDIGPWTGNPNTPANQNFCFKIMRSPQVKTGAKTGTPLGHIGVWKNGVSIFNAKDAFSYNNQKIWNQDALPNEGASFDECLGHPAPNGEYHHHVNPTCLYDDRDSSQHSPLIGYAFDGFPIYGAYGFKNADGTGAITRMRTSYRLRNISARTTLPDGTALTAAQYGPAINAQNPLGKYIEDYEYVSSLGDLDEYNGRMCKTPEYPAGIYAYFVTIDANYNPVFPYTVGLYYYGNVQAGNTGPQSGHNTSTGTIYTSKDTTGDTTTTPTASYNKLWIPDTLSGKVFNLRAKASTKQFLTGNKTVTAGINNDFWGPTLFINKGDSVQMNVTNELMDETTMHWHGMHLPPEMDGGPHQPIAPMTTWSPHWQVKNNAATYWYHPHLHMMTLGQITTGLGGLIIVRDSLESSLKLPRAYGVDDIPLVLTDRRFQAGTNDFVDVSYGDSMMVNGTLSPEVDLPAQIVRFRVLNASLERSYNLGFSDNRNFYVITSDGGLLDKPVAVTRYLLSAAERIEILLDLSGQQDKSVDLKAYNASLQGGIPGFEPSTQPGPLQNALGLRDFNILHINAKAQTANPVTAIPQTLTSNTFWNVGDSKATRTVLFSDTTINGRPAFNINHRATFDMEHIDFELRKDDVEIWEITNTSGVAHPFHIHDIEFHILTRNNVAPPESERGWKDVVLVKRNETVRFIAKFENFADSTHPYMFHCHIAAHEDAGLMGQFLVLQPKEIDTTTSVQENIFLKDELAMFPNPTSGKISLLKELDFTPEKVEIMNILGEKFTVEFNSAENSFNISALPAGLYFVRMSNREKQVLTGRILKQ